MNAWPRRFLAVPTSALAVDHRVRASAKGYTDLDLQEIAATIPAIYDRMASGASERDLRDAAVAADPAERQLGKTYGQLFLDEPASQPLTAAYDGRDLVVGDGNHRIMAARAIEVPVLPVWVHAPTVDDLDRVQDACDRRMEREGTTAYRDAHASHEQTRARGGLDGRPRNIEAGERGEASERLWERWH